MFRQIPESELEWTFATSSGPGGQNVNKTATKAQLRWSVSGSATLNDDEKRIITEKLANRLTQDGFIAIDVSEERSQLQNKQRAVELLHELVNAALEPEIPRVATKVPKSEKLDRLANKRKRKQIKQFRQSVDEE